MQPQSPYTFNTLPGGNVEVFQGGNRISTGTQQAAAAYGFDPTVQQAAPKPNPNTKVTPTTISGDKSQQIAENTKAVNDINAGRQKTPTEFTGGLQQYSDGTPIAAPSDAIMQFDENGNSWWSSGGKNYAIGPDQGISKETKDTQDMLESLKTQTDKVFADRIAAVQAQFQSLIRIQKDVNARQEASVGQTLLTGGTSRYAGLNDAGLMQGQISYGVQQVADLVNKENMAVAELNQAQADKDYQIVAKQLQVIDDIKKEKQKALTDLNTKLVDANKTIRQQIQTQNNAIDNDIRTAILDAQKGGATPAQIAEMQKALANHDYAAAVAAGGESLSNASGIVGEYNFYVRDAKARGQIPVSFNEYQTMDANRKARVAAAGVAGASGYSSTVLTKINQVAGQFDNEQVVKDYNTIAQQVESVKTAGVTPTDDIQRIYAFAKVMDPQSAVREGEYKTIQEYSTALLQRAGLKANRVFNNSGFLTDEARKFILNTLDNRLKSTEKSFKNIKDEYARRINKVSGGKDGSEFLTDYSKGYTSTGSDLIQSEEQKSQKIESALTTLKTSNPKLFNAASKMYTSVNPSTGVPYTSDEILQAFPELNQ